MTDTSPHRAPRRLRSRSGLRVMHPTTCPSYLPEWASLCRPGRALSRSSVGRDRESCRKVSCSHGQWAIKDSEALPSIQRMSALGHKQTFREYPQNVRFWGRGWASSRPYPLDGRRIILVISKKSKGKSQQSQKLETGHPYIDDTRRRGVQYVHETLPCSTVAPDAWSCPT